MNEHNKFEWGPLARGAYMALLWLTLLVAWVAPAALLFHVSLLLFLGLGLRPLLEKTGIAGFFSRLHNKYEEGRWKRITEERTREVERKARDQKYRTARRKDPRLPPNW